MYRLSLYNGQNEVVIHYPSNNQDDPHVTKLPLKETISVVDSLTFTLYPNNPGYNSVFELTTRVRSFDVRDNTTRFTGRVLSINEKMDNNGTMYKDISCEGAMSYLNDTKQRGSSFTADTGYSFLTQILNVHNSKVDDSKKIYAGDINIGKDIIHGCQYRTTLAEILEVVKEIGGMIRVREYNGRLYLDWKDSFEPYTLNVSLGVNMKEMVVSRDVASLGTRIIPLGANNLTIESVNGGVDYLEDTAAVNKYGVIEKTAEYRDIEDAKELMNTCYNKLSDYTQPKYVLSTGALDLSYLTGNKAEQFKLGTKLHIVNEFMNVDDSYTITEMSLDLLKPYDPTLTISNNPTKLTNTITDLRKETIQNDGIYNNVQIGKSFGIRAVRNDFKAVTTLNATEGIKIQSDRGHGLVDMFFIDINGNLRIVTYDEITGKLSSSLDLNDKKISAVVETTDGGSSWELNKNKFIVAFNKAGGGYTEISSGGIVIYDGKFRIKKNSSTVFYVNTKGRCTADGGFVVDDGDTSTEIDSDGITITNDAGYSGTMTVSSRFDRLEIPDSLFANQLIASACDVQNDLQVEGDFDIDGRASFYGIAQFDDNAHMDGDLTVDGDLRVHGRKNCYQSTNHYDRRGIDAYETAENYFGDIGNGKINNGECVVYIDDIFSECVNTNVEYQVDIFEYSNRGSITDVERHTNYFVVRGNIDDLEFGWEIKVKRKGYENNRLEQEPVNYNVNTRKTEKVLLSDNVVDNSGYLLKNSIANIEDILLEEGI